MNTATKPAAKPRVSLRSHGQHVVEYAGRRGILLDDVVYHGKKVVAVDADGNLDQRQSWHGWNDKAAVCRFVEAIDLELEMEAAKARAAKSKGTVVLAKRLCGYSVEVRAGKSIRITGESARGRGEPVDIMYSVGDTAEYGSYNLHYLGEILSITAKTVTIRETDGSKHRLTIELFVSRNDRPVAHKVEQNAETMMHI